MTADERLTAIRLKIEWAEKYLRDLERELRAFRDHCPYKVGIEYNFQPPARAIHRLTKAGKVPITVALLTGDVIHNLRSALDHLAYHLVLFGTGKPGPFPQVSYPVAEDATEYGASKRRKVKGMRDVAIQAIDATEPYKGGKGDTLWRLHKLDIIDKHRLILVVGAMLHHVEVGQVVQEALRIEQFHPVPASPITRLLLLKEGDELWTTELGREFAASQMHESLQFSVDVAFHEPEVFGGEPVLETLHDMANAVDYLVTSFKPLLS